MKPFLPDPGPGPLERLAGPRVLFAFDFDGTLAPLMSDRDAPRMRPRTQALFTRLAHAAPIAVISGRARADVKKRLGGAPVKYVAGNHGSELFDDGPFDAQRLDAVRAALRAVERGTPRLELEDKQFGFAVHFRDHHPAALVESLVTQALAGLAPRMRLLGGIGVLNVMPAQAPHKGDTVEALMRREGATAALFVGDDLTDEDVFDLPPRDELVTIRVGPRPQSRARFYLRDQQEIDDLLGRLVELRPERAP